MSYGQIESLVTCYQALSWKLSVLKFCMPLPTSVVPLLHAMTNTAIRSFLILPVLCSLAVAQSAVQTTTTTEAPAPQVRTRTYVNSNGETVSERVTTTVVRESESARKTYRAAIFVTNRSGRDNDEKIPVLEDFISSQITDLGFSVLTREATVDSLRKFDPEVASKARPADSLDAQLTDQSSALRLAQNMGVDYIVQASIAGFTRKINNVKAYGVDSKNEELTLRVTYKILDAAAGGSLTGDTVRVSSTVQQTAASATELTGAFDELLDKAAQQVTSSLSARLARDRIGPPAAKAAMVTISVQIEAADVMIPDVRIGAENTVSISESKHRVSPLNATVEVDGVTVGTAPGPIMLRPGFTKLRITREGFKPWERTINAVSGQTLTVALAMNDEGYRRWKDATDFINGLKNGAKLTDAQVKVLEGYGKMLSESFSRMDTKENVKLIIPGVRF